MTRTLVTGATGLIGRELVPRLLARGEHVIALVRPGTAAAQRDRLDAWAAAGELTVLLGDVRAPRLGLDDDALEALGALAHVHHLAALYDLGADEADVHAVNVGGTEHLLALLEELGFEGVLHHVSSVAVAGDHDGPFGEDALDEKQGFPTPYHRSKHASEARVRESGLRFRVYRPSAVVGHSATGEMDRIDGPYFLFRAIHKLRYGLPGWLALPGLDPGPLNMVPVDFVAAAIDAIAHAPGLDGRGFHLVDPSPPKFVETFNLIADAAGAPRMSRRRVSSMIKMVPGVEQVAGQLGALRFLRRELAADFGIPPAASEASNASIEYRSENVEAALAGTGVACPPQREYIEVLWDHYERHLDPERDLEKRNRAHFDGKRALITGGSSGIGAALARQLGRAGAHVVVVARREAELREVVEDITAAGGRASYVVADLSDLEECDRVVQTIHDEHGPIDLLVNNAGRSIRRPLSESLERWHDLERVMQLNYFSPARLIRAVLPTMRERGGHIVNVLSAGAHIPSPRFGAYTASKAALSQLGDVLAAEHLHEGIRVIGAYLPWVRTPMMDATGKYEDTQAMSPEEAAAMILDGVVNRRQHVALGKDTRRHMWSRLYPRGLARILNVLYRIYADDPAQHPELALDRAILKRFVKGRLM